MEHLKLCPLCGCENFEKSRKVMDHFLTKETFQIARCTRCGFLFTNPRPDSSEITRYYQSDAYISHSKKRKGWLNIIYAEVRKIALRKKFALINRYKSGSRILDIGCGTGEFLNYMNKKGWETTGIEPAGQPRKFAKENYGLDVFDEGMLKNLPENSFDVITMWHVLEHVHDLNGRLDRVRQLLTPDGLLVIAVPNPESQDADFYCNHWAAWDVPRHLYHFSRHTLSLLLKKRGLEVFSIHPMKFDAYYVSLLSEKYKYGKTRLPTALYRGFKSNKSAKKNENNYSSMIFLIKRQNS